MLQDGPPFLVGPRDGVLGRRGSSSGRGRGRSRSRSRREAPRLGVGAAEDGGEVVDGVGRPRDARARVRRGAEPLDQGGLGDVGGEGPGGRGGGVGGGLALGSEVLLIFFF